MTKVGDRNLDDGAASMNLLELEIVTDGASLLFLSLSLSLSMIYYPLGRQLLPPPSSHVLFAND